jgi:ectoine hydroxylase-related dioxygenase (phytanoyl-CoA dioxygenase family)
MLPDLSNEYVVSAERVDSFRRDGFVLLRGVASHDEVAAYRPAILAARDRFGPAPTPLEDRNTYGKAFLKGINLWERDEATRWFVLARRFAKVAADLLGVDGVRIYHDQALLKEASGGITPWHQDQHYWPLDTSNTVTMWMPLVDLTPEMGTMRFAAGSHREGYLGDMPISDDSEARLEGFVRARGFRVDPGQAMAAGDATFHYGWMLHGAPGNSTTRTREVMTIIWFADRAHITEPDNFNRRRDLARWMPGLQPGDLAASELNPLVYQR